MNKYKIKNYDNSKLDYRFINAARQRNRLSKKWNKAFNNAYSFDESTKRFNYWSKVAIKLSDKIAHWQDELEKFRNR